MSMKNPVHPGNIVREDCIAASELTVTDAAKVLGITRQTLNNLVNEKAAMSPEMALRLEKVGWGNAASWMQLQMNWELAQIRAREGEIVVNGLASGPA